MESRSWYKKLSQANTSRDGTGEMEGVVTVRPQGANIAIDTVELVAQATTTAGVIRLFVDDGRGGPEGISLIHEQLVTAVTPGTGQAVWSATVSLVTVSYDTLYAPLVLLPGWTLYASTHNAEAFTVLAHGRIM